MNRLKHGFFSFSILIGFLLGCHQGYIALWPEGATEPVQVYPYRVTSLPLADQQALRDGIHVDSEQELAMLLEDYLS